MPLLQELLDVGLIELNGDDARYGYIQETATALGKHFVQNPGDSIPAILVAMDDQAGDDEPQLKRAEDLLKTLWKTLRNIHKERPRSMLRCIIFDALRQAGEQSSTVAAAVALTAESVYPHLRLGAEKEIFQRVLSDFSEAMEKQSAQISNSEMLPQSGISNKPVTLKIPPLSINDALISALDYYTIVAGAAGPHDHRGAISGAIYEQPLWNQNSGENQNANALWPSNNGAWVGAFGFRMAEVLARAVNAGTKGLIVQLKSAVEVWRTSVEVELKQKIDNLDLNTKQYLERNQEQAEYARLKTDVLWWLESLYSTSQRQSYRDMPAPKAAILMTWDLFRLVDRRLPTPASLTYVLAEAVSRLKEGDNPPSRLPILELLRQVHAQCSNLRGYIAPSDGVSGRRPLLLVVEASIHHNVPSADELRNQTGLWAEATLSLPELAMWCFRDLQARQLCRKGGT